MSNIPAARELLEYAVIGEPDHNLRAIIKRVLPMLTREKAVTRAPPNRENITPALRAQVFALAALGVSQHEIATLTGLHSSGRPSEILTGKR